LDVLSFDSISEEVAVCLERIFEEDEVFEVLKALISDKAPGLDSFIMGFFLKKIS
jgi:hypothetical protein